MRSENHPARLPKQKTCSKCKKIQPMTEFNFRHRSAGIRHSYCKECGKALTRNHYANNKRQYLDRNIRSYLKRREFIRQIKSRPCADCGIQYPYYVMDFDHREGEDKKYELNSITQMIISAVMSEIEKCDVVCSNCHRERTQRRKAWKRSDI